jgi:hypothetical protein
VCIDAARAVEVIQADIVTKVWQRLKEGQRE